MDIAIIGMSGVFPKADDLNEYYINLANGVDSVRSIPNRRNRGGKIKDNNFGYLDQIDEFDYNFFNLSKAEADNMDPSQRMLLELVCKAIDNSGYSLEEYKNTNTSVILNSLGAPKLEYVDLVKNFHPTLITGNAHSMPAGRISYYFGLKGPSMMIDTSCSSALTCLHESINKLKLGEVEQAITGGIRILPNLNYTRKHNFGIGSKDNKCKVFDDSADGIIGGEGGGILILKPLEKALKDKDNIQALIKGSATNQDGNRSNGITAPSPKAQTEVILKAWERADINPRTIGYIEAHGTGTNIGDPIEIQGLTDAFNQITSDRKFCHIGSVKSNIGHLSESAGIASIIKTVLSLKYKKIFPSLHFNKPNKLINFEDTAIKVNTRLRNWDINEGEKRRAGVSGFSLTGANAHIVLEEAPGIKRPKVKEELPYLVTVSAKNKNSLTQYKERLNEHLRNSIDDLRDISFTLNRGRNDYSIRESFVVKDKQELISKLRFSDVNLEEKSKKDVIFLFGHKISIPEELFIFLTTEFTEGAKIYKEILNSEIDIGSEFAKNIIFQYLSYRYWISVGVTPLKIIGTGVGNLLVEHITGDLSFNGLMEKLNGFSLENTIDNQKLISFINESNKIADPVFLDMSFQSDLGSEISNTDLKDIIVINSHKEDNVNSLIETQSELYNNGVYLDWKIYYKENEAYRVELPHYPFEKQSCWVEEKIQSENITESLENDELLDQGEQGSYSSDYSNDSSSLKINITNVWMDALSLENVDSKEDFFELGGNSLISLHIIERLEEMYGVEIDYDSLFTYSTIDELTEYMMSLVQEEQVVSEKPQVESKSTINNELSYSEESMWYLAHYESDSSSYNIPSGIHLKGNLNTKILTESVVELVSRHDNLRTIYPQKDGKPVAIVKPIENWDYILPIIDLTDVEDSFKEKKVTSIFRDNTITPFDLEKGPLYRFLLIKIEENHHVLISIMHHIISDNWSYQIFQNELVNVYQSLINNEKPHLENLEYQFRDYAKLQRSTTERDKLKQQLAFWESNLKNAPELLSLPTQSKRPAVQSFQGETYSFEIPKDLVSELSKLSKKENVTLFMTLLASWKSLLFRYSGQKDIVIGVPTVGRKTKYEKTMGNFVNTVPVRTIVSEDLKFTELLQIIKNDFVEVLKNSDVPFNKIVEHLNIQRKLEFTPVFQVLFDFHHNHLIQDLDVPNFEVEPLVKPIETVMGDLEMILMSSKEKIKGLFIYNTDIFEKDEMKKMVDNFIRLLETIINSPTIKTRDIELVDVQDKNESKVLSTISNEDFNF
ncbi:hypothetical protein FZC78_22535 [Rossellomorea vietnamensis]|uniref:Uncharacterized protein n=1 Tax=Rossellomorea vietnamensis TaxID=218284 RepID=A0A5D4NI71_9BACI|nr:condensation domain-containing protein [Rossellomorea vietnamensis]TYS13036.1 hypothetical protein FZC78_22535 [Rossellomorea vietnamensis]